MKDKRCHICGNEVRENYYLDKRGYTCYSCSREINMQKKSNQKFTNVENIIYKVGKVFARTKTKVDAKIICKELNKE